MKAKLKNEKLAARKRAARIFETLEPRWLLTTFTPANSAALTTALDSAQLGDTIVLNSGTTYTGGFVLKNKTSGSGWITVQSSALASLPAMGVRVAPTDATNMPKIISPGSNVPDIATQAGAHHFKFVGIEFIGYIADKADGSAQTHTTIMELGNDTQSTVASMPNHIIVDRCYFHPDVYTRQVRRAIALHGAYIDVTNTYIEEIHEGSDSNAIIGWNGSGPYNIINNHLEGAGENILFGGATQVVPTTDSNVVIRGNDVVKPLYWLEGYYKDPSHPYPANYWVSSTHTEANTVFKVNFKGNRGPVVKNLLELKEGSHFVVEDNIFEDSWVSGQDGVAILFKLGDYNDSYNANGGKGVVDEDVIFRNNIVRHAARGVTFQGRDYAATSPSDPGGLVRRFKIENNWWDDISTKDASGNGVWGGYSPFAYVLYGPKNVEFRHNTINNGYTPLELDDNIITQWPSPGFVFTDNIVNMNDYGIRGSSGSGDIGIHTYLPDGLFKGNVFVDTHTDVSSPGNYDNVAPASWPGNLNAPRVRYVNFFARNDGVTNNVGYVDSAHGNYRLTSSAASTYINGVSFHDTQESPAVDGTTKTTDGTAPGANFDLLDAATAGATSGNWQFAYVVGSRLFIHFDGSGTPISLSMSGSNLVVSEAGQTTLTVPASSISAINVVDSTSDDTLQISGAVSPAMIQQSNTSGNDLIQLSGATFSFDSDLSTGSQYWSVPNWGVYVASGATATFNATQHLRSLSVDGTASLSAGGAKVLSVTDLQVTGKLNLNDNDLIWDYTAGSPIGAWAGTAYSGLTGLIQSGRASGAWTGNGLITSQSNAAGGSALTTLGIAEASDVLTYTNGVATYAGQAVDSTAVIVKYTYIGDANLSGRMDGDDYFRIDNAYVGGTPSFLHGDFNLNGKINADDYFLLDSKINKQQIGIL